MFATIWSRLQEPSTHAGIAVLLQGASMAFPQYSVFITGFSVAFGFGAVGLAERRS